MPPRELQEITQDLERCKLCSEHLVDGVRPIFQLHPDARLLIAGQAPGIRTHRSGIPFDDPSGERLRTWMGLSAEQFHDARFIAILPMAFCYPGRGRSGDLAPRRECAATWHEEILSRLTRIRLRLILGRHALAYHRPDLADLGLDEAVRASLREASGDLVLPHPSPRNNIWLKKHSWFEERVLPDLQRRIAALRG